VSVYCLATSVMALRSLSKDSWTSGLKVFVS
jgi:hypothetical protein